MKLSQITKFVNRIQQAKPKWDYDSIQVQLIEDIRKNVDGFHLANIILKKYMDHKKQPSVDQIENVILTMKAINNSDGGSGCEKCRRGFISIFNHNIWYYDTEINGYISHHDWSPNEIESLFILPTTSVACLCSNSKIKKISSYLHWLEKFSFIAPDFFELCYIQLYLFYSHILEHSIKFNEFDPWSFWGVKSNADTTFTQDEITNQRIKYMLLDIENGRTGSNIKENIKVIKQGLRQLPPNQRNNKKRVIL